MKSTTLPLALFAALVFSAPVDARELKGRARVVDGDTLYVGGVKVRLNGIDATERGQARYRAATRALLRKSYQLDRGALASFRKY